MVDAVPGLRLGISGAYASGDLKNHDGRTSVDMDTVGFGVYASYILPNNVFFDLNTAYATTSNDYTTNLVTGGKKTGSFDINTWQIGLRGGVVFKGDNYQIVPSVGVRYVWLRQDSFTDKLDAEARAAKYPAVSYAARTDQQVDIPVQVKFNTLVKAGSATLTPELRLGYTFAAKKPDNEMTASFSGVDEYQITGTRSRGNSFQAGVGLKINTGGAVDAFINYDLDISQGYRSHNASLVIGFVF
jgi:outer membrane autotransporter protein